MIYHLIEVESFRERLLSGLRHASSVRPRERQLDNTMGHSQTGHMDNLAIFQALANDRRLQILSWLKDPEVNFRPQVDGDLVKDGVCAILIAEKLGLSQPTLSEHMRILCQSQLVRPKRIKQWTFYKRNERLIREFKRALKAEL